MINISQRINLSAKLNKNKQYHQKKKKKKTLQDAQIKRLKAVMILATSLGGARVVMVIVVGYGHGDTSSNPGRD